MVSSCFVPVVEFHNYARDKPELRFYFPFRDKGCLKRWVEPVIIVCSDDFTEGILKFAIHLYLCE